MNGHAERNNNSLTFISRKEEFTMHLRYSLTFMFCVMCET